MGWEGGDGMGVYLWSVFSGSDGMGWDELGYVRAWGGSYGDGSPPPG